MLQSLPIIFRRKICQAHACRASRIFQKAIAAKIGARNLFRFHPRQVNREPD
jgi:hypothetical protein